MDIVEGLNKLITYDINKVYEIVIRTETIHEYRRIVQSLNGYRLTLQELHVGWGMHKENTCIMIYKDEGDVLWDYAHYNYYSINYSNVPIVYSRQIVTI